MPQYEVKVRLRGREEGGQRREERREEEGDEVLVQQCSGTHLPLCYEVELFLHCRAHGGLHQLRVNLREMRETSPPSTHQPATPAMTCSHLLVAVDQDNTQLGGYQSPPTVHVDIVTGADVLNVHWNTGILRWYGQSFSHTLILPFPFLTVPILCFSMRLISSLSVRYPGGVVSCSDNFI